NCGRFRTPPVKGISHPIRNYMGTVTHIAVRSASRIQDGRPSAVVARSKKGTVAIKHETIFSVPDIEWNHGPVQTARCRVQFVCEPYRLNVVSWINSQKFPNLRKIGPAQI